MIGDYSVMDWATLGGVVGIIFTNVGVLISNSRDNKAIQRELELLEEGQEKLVDEFSKISTNQYDKYVLIQSNLSNNIEKNKQELVQKNSYVKEDTKYIRDEMLIEKKSREEVYNHVKNGDKLIEKMAFANELILKFGEVSRENQMLGLKVNSLEEKIVDLSNQPKNDEISKLRKSISSFERELSRFEDVGYSEAEEIKSTLRRI
ncbi:cytochrome P450 family protein, partial [Streptococcus agalactiae]